MLNPLNGHIQNDIKITTNLLVLVSPQALVNEVNLYVPVAYWCAIEQE